MAHAQQLPQDVLKHLASQLNSLLPQTIESTKLNRTPISLTETFPVWMLGADSVTKSDQPLEKLARRTGRWHHQIRFAGTADAYARSMPLGADAQSWDIREIYEGELAPQVDKAIDWIDKNVQDDPEVRLLVIPAYYTHAFWLVQPGNNQVVVIDAPKQYTNIQTQKVYTSREFLEALAKEQHATPEGSPAGVLV